MKYIGGYSILDLNDTPNVSEQANICYSQDKPVLVYDENGNKFFADTISKIGTNIIITKGGKTITINDANAVSSEGFVENPLMENIKDKSGNLRFIEGDGVLKQEITGVTLEYSKFSLSGTHLMLVASGNIANETVLDADNRITIYFENIPDWIFDKLYPMGTQYDIYDVKTIVIFSNDFSANQNVRFTVAGDREAHRLLISQQQNLTITTNAKNYRIQFDLLIDAE